MMVLDKPRNVIYVVTGRRIGGAAANAARSRGNACKAEGGRNQIADVAVARGSRQGRRCKERGKFQVVSNFSLLEKK